jgi:hypothetical protein
MVAMNDGANRVPADENVGRWFAAAQRADPDAVDGSAKSRLRRARRALATLLGQPELRRSA